MGHVSLGTINLSMLVFISGFNSPGVLFYCCVSCLQTLWGFWWSLNIELDFVSGNNGPTPAKYEVPCLTLSIWSHGHRHYICSKRYFLLVLQKASVQVFKQFVMGKHSNSMTEYLLFSTATSQQCNNFHTTGNAYTVIYSAIGHASALQHPRRFCSLCSPTSMAARSLDITPNSPAAGRWSWAHGLLHRVTSQASLPLLIG